MRSNQLLIQNQKRDNLKLSKSWSLSKMNQALNASDDAKEPDQQIQTMPRVLQMSSLQYNRRIDTK
ncbi:MAG: hypothetical protein HRT89_02335 [Lentisphaeria bacterium]|nr:hypothetical protein [Lentisphaeria bacterium]